jgi:hypothetical protein
MVEPGVDQRQRDGPDRGGNLSPEQECPDCFKLCGKRFVSHREDTLGAAQSLLADLRFAARTHRPVSSHRLCVRDSAALLADSPDRSNPPSRGASAG